MRQNPKPNITKLKLKEGYFGTRQRIEDAKEAFEQNLVFPKPVEYEDIDRAVLEFVRDRITLDAGGKKAPTFTLFSNQRFSEYSQTWEHVDEEGNLLMDFKTVNRLSNPSWGTNQGGIHNIPGDRQYTIQMKEVLDDNGTESYEVYSMGQPLSIDIYYTINYVTADWTKLNDFNFQINDCFKAIECYINPNGWYMPMEIENINDETEYAIDNRKIYIQSATIKVLGIIAPKSIFKIEKMPKRLFIGTIFDKKYLKPHVDVEEIDDKKSKIVLDFRANVNKVEFEFDDDVTVNVADFENIRDFQVFINDVKIMKPRESFPLHNGDWVKVRIFQIEKNLPSKIGFMCFKP